MNDSDDLIDALAPVVESLQKLRIRHFVGGSIASSFHGATRSTMDVDLVAELSEDRIAEFVGCFGDEFYLSEAAVRDAMKRRSCFNLIHLPSSFKLDIFVSRERPFEDESMNRATLELPCPRFCSRPYILYLGPAFERRHLTALPGIGSGLTCLNQP